MISYLFVTLQANENDMKKSVWLPAALLLVGTALYIYNGVEYNAWMQNLPMMIIDVVILVVLHFVLRKKEEYNKRYRR